MWTICFDATINVVNVEAETDGQAIEKAEKVMEGVEEALIEYLNRDGADQFDVSVGSVYLVKSDDGVEILK